MAPCMLFQAQNRDLSGASTGGTQSQILGPQLVIDHTHLQPQAGTDSAQLTPTVPNRHITDPLDAHDTVVPYLGVLHQSMALLSPRWCWAGSWHEHLETT